jgi:hypothetical protein
MAAVFGARVQTKGWHFCQPSLPVVATTAVVVWKSNLYFGEPFYL